MAAPCCFTGSEHPGTPLGHVETVHGLPTYVSEPTGPPKAVVVIVSDAFGWEFKNLRILADVYASRTGATVYLPDFMDGRSADPSLLPVLDTVLKPVPSWLEVFTTKVPAIWTLVTTFIPFIYHNRQSVAEPRVRTWFTSLRSNTSTTLKIGAAGFCWGGKYVTLLCHGPAATPSGLPLLDAGFTAHPSNLVLPTDIDGVEKPLSICIGDADFALGLAQVNRTKEILGAKAGAEERFEVVVLPGAAHGFAVRGHPEDKKEREQAQEAEDQAVEWFRKWCGTN